VRVSRTAAAVAALTLLGGLIRFWHLGSQSYWLDESYTVDLVSRGFGDMLSTIPRTESTPPLYYVLAWVWAKVFGTSEAGLRSLSALVGTAAVPVFYAAGRELFSKRVGVVAAALAAVNPFFVWQSQEARSYSLLVLLSALSLYCFARALRRQTARDFALWAVVAGLALLTHYFSIFLLLPEAAWLIWATRNRAALLASGGAAIVGLALLPLALEQRSHPYTAFIAGIALRARIEDLPKKIVTGELGTFTPLIGPIAGAILVGAIVFALVRGGRWRRTEWLLLGLAACAAAIPLLLAVAGTDYVLPRNMLPVYVPIVVAAAAGLALAGRIGVAATAAICVIAVVVNVQVTRDARLQRADWRGAAHVIGEPSTTRAIVISPEWDEKPLRLYAGSLPEMPASGARVREVIVIAEEHVRDTSEPTVPPGFRGVFGRQTASWRLIRYASPSPQQVTPGSLAASKIGPKPATVLIQQPKEPSP
jgi:uncharacterized membrane protein